jgi:hypothetical protein
MSSSIQVKIKKINTMPLLNDLEALYLSTVQSADSFVKLIKLD